MTQDETGSEADAPRSGSDDVADATSRGTDGAAVPEPPAPGTSSGSAGNGSVRWPDADGPTPLAPAASSAGAATAPDADPPGAPATPLPRESRRFWRRRAAKKPRQKAPWWELPVLIVVAIGVAILIKTFVVQPFYIPSQSMEQTLHGCPGCSGDRILVNKPIYHLRDPHPGDIVVFKAPTDEWFNEPYPTPPSNPIAKVARGFGQLIGVVPPDEHDLVKRVIATGGQTIKCCDTAGNIQISDTGPSGPWRTLHENYIYSPLSPTDGAFGPVTVPKGRLWVMGDNRSNSDDSRYHYVNDYRGDATLSTVPVSDVIGKAVVIAWPPSRWRTLGTPSTFKSSAAALGSGAIPVLGAGAVVLPIGLVRRRRRPRRE